MPDSSSQNAVVSFQQQGQVDWVGLSNSTVSFTLGVLSRMCKAGVDPLTYTIGRALCKKTILPPEGQSKIENVISNLRSWPSFNKILWFGFGERHLIHELALTGEGLTLVALCSAIQENYGEYFGARTFQQLSIMMNAPDDLTPSLHQWRALVKVCQGLLSSGDFAKKVESFSRLFCPVTSTPNIQSRATSPEAIAKAIRSLGELSIHQREIYKFRGGLDCAWLAAVAEWLYGLHIEICDRSGSIMYRSSGYCRTRSQIPQVQIIKDEEIRRCPNIVSKSIVVHSAMDIIRPGDKWFSLYQRVSWNDLLKQTFGTETLRFLLHGDVGRAFACIVCWPFFKGHYNSSALSLFPYEFCHSNKSVDDFLRSSRQLLPELRNCLLKVTADVDIRDVTHYEKIIRNSCPCQRNLGSGLCLMKVTVAIARLLYALQDTEFQPNLLPVPDGLDRIYWETKLVGGHSVPEKSIFGKADTASELWRTDHNGRLSCLLKIFTGQSIKINHDTEAVCHEGICIFYKLLMNPDTPPVDILRVIVVNGTIQHNLTYFDRVSSHATKGDLPSAISVQESCYQNIARIDMIAEESENREELLLSFRAQKQSLESYFYGIHDIKDYIGNTNPNVCLHEVNERNNMLVSGQSFDSERVEHDRNPGIIQFPHLRYRLDSINHHDKIETGQRQGSQAESFNLHEIYDKLSGEMSYWSLVYSSPGEDTTGYCLAAPPANDLSSKYLQNNPYAYLYSIMTLIHPSDRINVKLTRVTPDCASCMLQTILESVPEQLIWQFRRQRSLNLVFLNHRIRKDVTLLLDEGQPICT